jgi:hypothetical protein
MEDMSLRRNRKGLVGKIPKTYGSYADTPSKKNAPDRRRSFVLISFTLRT